MAYKCISKNTLFYILFAIIGVWTLPWPIALPHSGLDPSWVIGINIAIAENLQFGEDIAFTFGPLGHLYTPWYIDHSLWFQSLIFNILLRILFTFCIASLVIKSSSNWKEYVFIVPILLIPDGFIRDYSLLISVNIILYLLVLNKIDDKYKIYLLFFSSALLAIASLIKFSMMIASVSVIIAFLIVSIMNNKSKDVALFTILYVSFVLLLWEIAGQHLSNFASFLINGYQISSGYSDGMAIKGRAWELYVGLVGITFIMVSFIYSLTKKNQNDLCAFIILNSGVMFLVFKHGFVRHDAHVFTFFAIYIYFLLSIYFIYKTNSDISHTLRIISLLLSILFISSLLQGVPGILTENIIGKSSAYQLSWSLISNQSHQIQALDGAKYDIRNGNFVNEKNINYLNNKSVDIFPWDIALVWAYDFNWSPRPVFQSYSAYTPHLDKLNAQYLSSEGAPQSILYAYKSIDRRYPIFDEPATFANILYNYTYVDKSGEFIVLSYNPEENTSRVEEDLGIVEVELGEPIKIPRYDSGYVFGYVELEYSSLGKLMKFIYKPAFAHIRFKSFESIYSNEYRYIPGISMNGIFLSQYLGTTDDLASVLSGNITQDISEIIIDVDNHNHYKRYISVHFVGVPANVSIRNISEPTINWNILKPAEGGMMAIDIVANELHSKKGSSISTNKQKEPYIIISGWAVDDLSKDGNVKTYIVFKNEDDEIIIPTKKTYRPDVANHFGIENYNNSGWVTMVQTRDFKDGCYNISLRILRMNGDEYYELDGTKAFCFS